MKDKGAGKLHYARFATRWKNIAELKGEKVTLILSPHLDDIFLSLYATLSSGKLGKNIIGVNFFTSSDSAVSTNVDTTFSTIVKTSLIRMNEELEFSRVLFLQGINYLPAFMGLKDASIERYYEFIASGAIGRLPEGTARKAGLNLYNRMVASYVRELQLGSSLAPLLRQFRSNIKNVLVPLGIGTHLDHGVIARLTNEFPRSTKLGLYAEIPYVYMSGNMSIDKLRAKAPEGFSKTTVTYFDPKKKDGLFRRIYGSQYEKRTSEAIHTVGEKLGEVVLWRHS